MKIAILSDSHDNTINTIQAVEKIEKLGAEMLIFCGDFCSPGPGIAMSKFKGPIYAVFGNNDGDKLHLVQYTSAGRNDVTFFDEGDGQVKLDGKRIAITHYPKYAALFAKSGDYDLVCFGHDHKPRIEKYDNCIAINPGTLNPNPFRKGTITSFGMYDTDTHEAGLYNLDGSALL